VPEVRIAIAGDESSLSDLAARTFKQTYAKDNTAENLLSHLRESFHPDKQRLEIEDESMRTFVVEDGVELIAFAQIRLGQCPTGQGSIADSELWRIYVDQAHQGKGIGSILLEKSIGEAISNDSRLLWLGVSEGNEKAISFYRQNGFDEVGEHKFRVGDDLQRDLVLAKILNAA